MTTTIAKELKLHEAGGRIAPREDLPGPVYKIRIMGWEPGAKNTEGSSALYPVDVLKETVPAAFPAGTRMRANHDGLCDEGGDVQRLAAKTLDTPWEEADGMYTNARIAPAYAQTMEHFADAIGVSISAAGELVMVENEDGDMVVFRDDETGLPVLKRLFSAEESPYNAIDFVEAPGADGRIVALVTEAKKAFREMNVREQATFASTFIEKKTSGAAGDKPEAVQPEENKKEITMDPELKEALETMRTSIIAEVTEALVPAAPAGDEIDLVAVERAGVEAGLPEELRDEVLEAARDGRDHEAVLEARKGLVEKITRQVEEKLAAPGYITTEGKSASIDSDAFERELDEALGLGKGGI